MAQVKPLTEDQLSTIMWGGIASEMLYAAAHFGVFTYLTTHPGATFAEVAASTELDTYSAEILLNGLRGLKLIHGDDTNLHNDPLVHERFVHGHDALHLPFIHEIVNTGCRDLIDSLQQATNVGLRNWPGTGETLYARLENHPAGQRSLHDHLRATSDATLDSLIATDIFADSNHLLDIGGGTGTNAIALAGHYSQLHITIVDLPSVIEVAAENIQQHQLADRIHLCAADVFNDPLPETADTALLAHMLPIWPAATNERLLKKVNDVLPEGGRVVLFDPMQNDARDGPVYSMLQCR